MIVGGAFRKFPIRAFAAIVFGFFVAGCREPQPRRETTAEKLPPYPAAPATAPAPGVPADPPRLPVAGRTVILDAGHGGADAGASWNGLREKDITLDLALRTAAVLRAGGVNVLFTRRTDVFVPLPERSAFANRHPDAAFVSIHVNASEKNAAAAGVETFVLAATRNDAERGRAAAGQYRVRGDDSGKSGEILASLAARCRYRGEALAEAVQRRLAARLAVPDRGVKRADFAVLRETYFCSAVLVEVGFISHSPTAAAMRTGEWRQRTAEALGEGIIDFLGRPDGG
ncbi:MAG: N-acetylmuramoyl-L-alanine amidase [Planctomycetota bacterium]|jgi:N-acetylmuramoyl-L-alanine amidase|nr:N-acetylmuramoyl-L-alanine amidase [Planctomycetota bacterium]